MSALQSPTQGMSVPQSGGTWAQIRQQTRALEGQVGAFGREFLRIEADHAKTEGYFHKYSQFSSSNNIPLKPTEDEKQTEAAIHDLLDKVRIPDSSAPLPTCPSIG